MVNNSPEREYPERPVLFYFSSHTDLFWTFLKVSFKLGVIRKPQQKLYPTWNYTEHWPERGEGILLRAEMKQEKRKVPFFSWGLWCLSPGWVWAGSGRNLLGIRRAEDGGDPPLQGMTPDRSIRDSSDVQSTTPLTSFLTRRRSGQNCSLHEENILLPSRVKS